MSFKDEAALLRALSSLQQGGSIQESADELGRLQAALDLKGGRNQRAFIARALGKWRSLPGEHQGQHAVLLSGLWRYHISQKNLRVADRASRLLINRGKRLDRLGIQGEGWFGCGSICLLQGKLELAIPYLELARALFASTGVNQRDVIRVSIVLADAYGLNGDRRASISMLYRARGDCLRLEDADLLASVSQALGVYQLEAGDISRAIQCFEFVVGSSRILKRRKREIRGRLGLVLAYLRSGELENGKELAQVVLSDAKSLGFKRELALACEYLATAVSGENPKAAMRLYHRASRLSKDGAADIKVEIHRKLAEFWLARGTHRRVTLHVNRGLTFDTEAEDRLALKRLRATVVGEQGSVEALQKLFEHEELAHRLGYEYERLLTILSIVRVAHFLNRRDLVKNWLEKGRALAQLCGARKLPEELEKWLEDQIQTSKSLDRDEYSSPELVAELPKVNLRSHGIVTVSKQLDEQASWIAKMAPGTVPVLIEGESGTGKELFARLVHQLSDRKNRAFLTINCGALPAELLESELFGHRRGAFTGAIVDKVGLFRAAHNGTLFLDEIGEMSGAAQAKLLRVLETGELRQVGDIRTETVNVRVVAATNASLIKAVRDGEFRLDLYHRLNGLHIYLPPLRDRMMDIPLLAEHFLQHCNRELGKDLSLPFGTRQWLMGLSWEGNVRQLRLAVQKASHLAPRSGELKPYHFVNIDQNHRVKSLSGELEEIERSRIRSALDATGGVVSAAAKLLGMTRTTLSSRMKRLGIRRDG